MRIAAALETSRSYACGRSTLRASRKQDLNHPPSAWDVAAQQTDLTIGE
jgi:hypothetical protein